MSTTPVFSSNISEYRWGEQLNKHFIIYINNRPSIFQVPKSVCDTNPEAYTPQQMGIGAYHHFRPDLVEMDGRKVEAVKKFLENNKGQLEEFKSLIVDRVKALEPSIRSCYNKYLDLDGDTLAWIMAIDGVYLLHLLSTYQGKDTIHTDDRDLAEDIFMLENQLPCIVLKEIKMAAKEIKNAAKEIKNALQPPDEEEDEDEEEDDKEIKKAAKEIKNALQPPDEEENEDEEEDDEEIKNALQPLDEEEYEDEEEDDKPPEEDDKPPDADDKELFSEMLTFCNKHSPLDLEVNPRYVNVTTNPHILSYMYSLVMRNWHGPKGVFGSLMAGGLPDQFLQAARLAGELTGEKLLIFLAKLPLQQFFDLFRKDNPTTDSSIEQIKIPSASQLRKACKVEFLVWQESGNGVKYLEEERTLCLPVIKLNTDSEVILRNLVAYEVALGSNNVVSGFVDFMCGLIDTAEDVDLLRDKEIIISDLPSPEIAKMFNGISKSNRMKADLEAYTQKLNLVYDSSFRVKAGRFIKNRCVPSETTVKLILSILVIGLLSLQAFCQVYGCSTNWFRSFGKINSIFSNPQVETLGISPE